MRLWEIFEDCRLDEASDLHCQNCGDNLGKDTENAKHAYCGNCGSKTFNRRGYVDLDESLKPIIPSLRKSAAK